MGAPKYNIWVDPGAAATREKLWGVADSIGNEANSLKTHSDLTDIGESELASIKAGRFGDTLLGGALKQQATRQKTGNANNYALGATRMAASNPNANLLYTRQLDRANRRADQDANDALSRGLVNYTNAAGDWSLTDNKLKAQKVGMLGAQGNMINAGWNAQRSGTQYTRKKSGWDIFKEVAGVGLNIAGLAMGVPGLGMLGGMLGGGSRGPQSADAPGAGAGSEWPI